MKELKRETIQISWNIPNKEVLQKVQDPTMRFDPVQNLVFFSLFWLLLLLFVFGPNLIFSPQLLTPKIILDLSQAINKLELITTTTPVIQ